MAAKWVRSYHVGNGKILGQIFCSMFPMNMIYFIYKLYHRYWISFQLQADKFEADLPLAKISWKSIIAGKFSTFHFRYFRHAQMSNTIFVKVMSRRNYFWYRDYLFLWLNQVRIELYKKKCEGLGTSWIYEYFARTYI